jgi:hypothetical protein
MAGRQIGGQGGQPEGDGGGCAFNAISFVVCDDVLVQHPASKQRPSLTDIFAFGKRSNKVTWSFARKSQDIKLLSFLLLFKQKYQHRC